MDRAIELERILEQDQWIRRIARGLAGDASSAEDLAQDAWVVALEKERSERGFLYAVTRNLGRMRRRGDSRRAARERATARDEALPSTAEIAAELALRREVAEALFELEEPHRTALYLRFFRDLSLKDVARETGVSTSTAHDRVRIGLERMRGRLDASHGGDRRAWALGLLELAPAQGALTLFGSLAMGTGIKIAVGAGALAAGMWALRTIDTERDGVSRAELAARSTEQAETAPALESSAPAVSARTASEVVAVVPPASTPRIGGLVLDTSGAPIAAVPVGPEGGTEGATTTTTGRFELALHLAADARLHVLDDGYQTLVPGLEHSVDGRVIVAAPRVHLAGRVVDAYGVPLPSANVSLELEQAMFEDLGLRRPFGYSSELPQARTDELGAFTLPRAAGGEHVQLVVRCDGFASARFPAPAHDDPALELALERVDGIELAGVVLDSSGSPVPGASVSAGRGIVTTNDDGRFVLIWDPDDRGTYASRKNGVWVHDDPTTHLTAVKAGVGFDRLELERIDPATGIVLRLHEGQALRGRVERADGTPVPGAVVWPIQRTHFGELQGEIVRRRQVEDLLASGDACAVADERGVFALGDLLEREYELLVLDPVRVSSGPSVTAHPGDEDVVLRLLDAPVARVAGRIVDGTGRPIEGVTISAYNRERQSLPELAEIEVTSDSDGRFEFEELTTEAVFLQCYHESFFMHFEWLDNHEPGTLDELEIVVPLLCELEVDATGLPDLDATQLHVLDAEGKRLDIYESFGDHATSGMFTPIENGRTGVVQVPETARTLVLCNDDEELLRLPLDLDLRGRTRVEL